MAMTAKGIAPTAATVPFRVMMSAMTYKTPANGIAME